MFECKVCKEKDSRISDLKEQIGYFKAVLNPPTRPQEYIEPTHLQQDMILDGGGKEETSPENGPDTPEVLAERAAILSGTY